MIHLKLLQVFAGPSPHADEPVLLARLSASAELPWIDSACGRLELAYPDWLQSVPPLLSGRAVSPMQRLALTAARWALGALNEVRGDLRCAGWPDGPGMGPLAADLYLGYHDVGVSRQALELALRVLVLAGRDPDFSPARLQPALAALWKLCRQHHPDWQARLLMQAARARDIPFLPFVARHWQYGWGARSRVFFETASNADGMLGVQIARSKLQTKAALAALGVAAPHHVLVRDERELEQAAAKVGWPCVIKPVDLGGGKGVTANIATPAALGAAYANARRYSQGPLMVEAHCPGQDHRLFVLGGKLVAAVLREPPTVVGDGVRPLEQLVQALNTGRSSSLVRSGYLVPVAFDDILQQHLAAQGLTLASVPAAGQRVSLRSNANRSTGGCARDVTAAVHPEVRVLAETVADTLGLNAAGLDYLTHDISLPPGVGGGMMIEVNSTPGLAVLVTAGLDPVALAGRVLGEGVGRIPVTLTVISSSALAAARAEFEASVPQPGLAWVCGDLAAVAGLPLRAAAGGPWELVRCVLRHRSVQLLELVCTAEQLLQHGMPVDRVAQVRLCGVCLPEAWMALLRRRAGSVTEREPWPAEPVQGLLRPAVAVGEGG